MRFKQVEDVVVETANCIFGYIHTKEKARDNLLDLVALACQSYEQDEKFKAEINSYLRYRKLL